MVTTTAPPRRALDLPSRLAYAYAPITRALQKLHVTRAGERRPNPQDILLPDGYVAEVVATGFTTPVQCAFDDQGACYVCEAGHKADSPRASSAWTPARANVSR
jgi:hypothetical protein